MKKLIILFLFFTVTNSQPQSFDNIAKNIIYIDFGVFFSGNVGAIGIGLNYERMISKNVSVRTGVNIGLFGVAAGNDGFAGTGVSFPVTINYLTNNKNKFEVGLGGGPHFEIGNSSNYNLRFFPAARFGYRYQPDEKGAIFKIGAEVPANFYLSFAGAGYHF